MSKPENPPLFDGAYGKGDVPTYHSGITLRDLFAGMAMLGMEADPNQDHKAKGQAKFSYDIADAMLAEREKEKP